MKRSKFTDEQILAIVREGEAGRRSPTWCAPTASPSRPITGHAFRHARPRVINQNPAHHLRGEGEEVRSVAVGDGLRPEQTQGELVYEGRRIERMIRAFVLQKPRGDPPGTKCLI